MTVTGQTLLHLQLLCYTIYKGFCNTTAAFKTFRNISLVACVNVHSTIEEFVTLTLKITYANANFYRIFIKSNVNKMELDILNTEPAAPKKLSLKGKILIYTTGGLALGVSVICIPFISPALRKVCLPYVPATAEQLIGVRKALTGRSGRLLDVGSGDGRIVFTAAKLGFQADGVELNSILVYYSRLSALVNRYNNTQFYRKDLWTFNLKPYDNIVIFGVEQMMKEFECKLMQEVNNGTVIVACRFPLPNMKPTETIGHGIDTVWKYVIHK